MTVHARRAYAAYGAMTGGKNYQGLPMPSWDELGDVIQRAWIAAANAVRPHAAEVEAATFACECGEQFPTQLDRIEHKLDVEHTQEEQHMSELDTKLATISGALDTLSADDQRIIADLQTLQASGQTLTPDQEAQLDSILAKVQAVDAAVNAGDPAPVVTPPASGDDGSGDGSTPPVDDSDGSAAV